MLLAFYIFGSFLKLRPLRILSVLNPHPPNKHGVFRQRFLSSRRLSSPKDCTKERASQAAVESEEDRKDKHVPLMSSEIIIIIDTTMIVSIYMFFHSMVHALVKVGGHQVLRSRSVWLIPAGTVGTRWIIIVFRLKSREMTSLIVF